MKIEQKNAIDWPSFKLGLAVATVVGSALALFVRRNDMQIDTEDGPQLLIRPLSKDALEAVKVLTAFATANKGNTSLAISMSDKSQQQTDTSI
jgi:hypothetical protein